MTRPGAYLDYAATSAVRPPEVADAVAEYIRRCGGLPGRGGHRIASEAGAVAEACRAAVLDILGLPGPPERIAFMQNATQALNTALWGTVGPGEKIVVTAYDHAAVLRPAAALLRTRGAVVERIPGDTSGSIDLDRVVAAVRGARVLVVNVASNVLGNRLPVAEMAELAREAGALVLVDTAQGAGRLDLGLDRSAVDLVAFTGHKGLLGPQGIGGLWVRDGVDVEPLLSGGSGGDCRTDAMPSTMPFRLEAGTVNAPGLAGLLAGIEWLQATGVTAVHASEAAQKARLREGLLRIPGVQLLSPPAPDGVGIVTWRPVGADPVAIADRLDREWGVMGRAGIHCAPEAHKLLGTLDHGAVRFSVGWSTTADEVDLALDAVEAVVLSGSAG